MGAPTCAREPAKTRWDATTAKKGTVLFCHGFGLYAGKFEDLFHLLNGMGYDVVAHDARGHGRWQDEVITAYNVVDLAEAMVEHYRAVADERPIVMGVGTFGGFLACKILEAAGRDGERPPAVFYSVDYVPAPRWLLRRLQRPRLLRRLDRFEMGYAYRHLTNDEGASRRFIDDDPLARATMPLGVALTLAAVTHRLYAPGRPSHERHAFILGSADRFSDLRTARRCIRRQPGYAMFEVEGGSFLMHRDGPAVKRRFRDALVAAFAHVRPVAEGAFGRAA